MYQPGNPIPETEMRLTPARVPLKTGNYMTHGVFQPGQFQAPHDSTTKFELTDTEEHEGGKVSFDSFGVAQPLNLLLGEVAS